ncbi:zinc finger protein 485-like isoform X2 [Pseudophryne corroboree]|uniref:zinc finger protein 485-like isoform X2 n=1 Tax=Pseudophryne corroboree TaxID=495146 RepID=UPI00308136DF
MRREAQVTFADIAVSFSEEEWKGLHAQQKALYREVMTDNYHNLTSLGLSESAPEIVVKMESGEDPCVSQEHAGDWEVSGSRDTETAWTREVLIDRQGKERQNKRGDQRGSRNCAAGRRVVSRRSLRLEKRSPILWTDEGTARKTDSPNMATHSTEEPTHILSNHNTEKTAPILLSHSPDKTTPILPSHSTHKTTPILPSHSPDKTTPILPSHSPDKTMPILPSHSTDKTTSILPSHSTDKTTPILYHHDSGHNSSHYQPPIAGKERSLGRDRSAMQATNQYLRAINLKKPFKEECDVQENSDLSEDKEKLHTCTQCGESWNRLIDFLTHQMGNCQDRPYQCSMCAKTFVKKQHLSAHRRTHTEDKPYKCNQCGRSFRQSSTLTTHLWSHAGHKPFHCTCCTKRFSRKTDLVAHMRRHTGERPYECPYCWDRFIRKKSLQRHLQKHSGESLQAGWQQNYPRWKQSDNFLDVEYPTEKLPNVPPSETTSELCFRWDAEGNAESPEAEHLQLQEHDALGSVESVKIELEEEEHVPESATRREQATQTENKRPSRMHQEMLRELKRFRRSTAQAQHERDWMRAAMDQLAHEMKELKEMVASLCSSKPLSDACRSPSHPPTIVVQNSCPVWSQASDDRQSTESGQASPESSLQCEYGYGLDSLSEQNREHVSWMYENPHDEDDMLPTTTIKREDESDLGTSLDSPFYGLPQYAPCSMGERLPNIAMQPMSAEREWGLLARSAGKPGRFAALVFRAVVPFDIYKGWVNRVNLDGLRGRKGVPLNVKRRVMEIVERHFTLRKSDHSEIRNRLNEQLRTRRKSDKHPQPLF